MYCERLSWEWITTKQQEKSEKNKREMLLLFSRLGHRARHSIDFLLASRSLVDISPSTIASKHKIPKLHRKINSWVQQNPQVDFNTHSKWPSLCPIQHRHGEEWADGEMKGGRKDITGEDVVCINTPHLTRSPIKMKIAEHRNEQKLKSLNPFPFFFFAVFGTDCRCHFMLSHRTPRFTFLKLWQTDYSDNRI